MVLRVEKERRQKKKKIFEEGMFIEGKYLEKENILLPRRIKTETEKKENITEKGKLLPDGWTDGRVEGSMKGPHGHKKCLPNRRAIFVCSQILSPSMAEQDMSSLQCNLQRLNLDNGSIIGSMVVSF